MKSFHIVNLHSIPLERSYPNPYSHYYFFLIIESQFFPLGPQVFAEQKLRCQVYSEFLSFGIVILKTFFHTYQH